MAAKEMCIQNEAVKYSVSMGMKPSRGSGRSAQRYENSFF
ncbi:hypothetical protein CL3_11170 [butyrate-producing bacterium SM4/1]|nr:hypothetical protein CL3_11170 [butyrate-producing bacterium SM4/1]